MEKLIYELDKYFITNTRLRNFEKILRGIELNEFIQNEITEYNKNISMNRKVLYSNVKYEVVLFIFNGNYESSIHDHSSNGCVLKVIKGKLYQTLYNNKMSKCLVEDSTIELNENDTFYIENEEYMHKIINNSDFSMSLHIYSPPGYKCMYPIKL